MAVKSLNPEETAALREALSEFYSQKGGSRLLTQIFSAFDRNHDGRISRDELTLVLRTLHTGITDSRISDMMDAADVNKDGCIDLREFISVMERHKT